MGEIVLGIGTSHTPMLTLEPEHWAAYAAGDHRNQELMFPPDGIAAPYDEAVATLVPPAVRARTGTLEVFREQSRRCVVALDALAETIREVDPDVTVIVSDDQDEWFFENLMPSVALYWGASLPVIPRQVPEGPIGEALLRGYGDVEVDVPVYAALGRFLVEQLVEHDFDVAHMTYLEPVHGGRVARRYPTATGELDLVRTTEPRRQGLPHGFSFVVKRLFGNEPRPIVPLFQNTCYPPNAVTPRRCHALGTALAAVIAAWPEETRVAVIASGGLSHFVVDEELDRLLLDALAADDADAMRGLPRHRLHSAASESLNWVTVGAAMADTALTMELLDYVPVYRTEAGTGGGWAFARWR